MNGPRLQFFVVVSRWNTDELAKLLAFLAEVAVLCCCFHARPAYRPRRGREDNRAALQFFVVVSDPRVRCLGCLPPGRPCVLQFFVVVSPADKVLGIPRSQRPYLEVAVLCCCFVWLNA